MSVPSQSLLLGKAPVAPAPEWETAATFVENRSGSSTIVSGTAGTFVTKIAPAALATFGNNIRLTLKSTGGPFGFADVFVGRAAASGNAWGFDGGQQRLTFGGANGATIPAGGELLSDPAILTIDGSRALVIAVNTLTNSWPMQRINLNSTNYVSYIKASTQNADDAGAGPGATAGYTAYGGRIIGVSRIEMG